MIIPDGWPCALLPAQPPSVADRESGPTADDLLPQVIVEVPRGIVWGTDEVSDGTGASPVMRRVWTALSGWLADYYALAFDTATQTFPSAITVSLDDWESEYGLPDPCTSPASGVAGRINAVRARFGAQGGASPAYFVCLAASVGYDVTISEPSDFICDLSECDGDDTVVDSNGHHEWVVRLLGLGDIWFYPDDGVLDDTPLEGFLVATDLECILRRVAPAHTTLIFDYSVLDLGIAETSALVSRMIVQPDAARQSLIRELIVSLMESGVWDKLDCLYILAAHDAQAGLLNWKQASYDLSPVNAPLFSVDQGYQGNGSSAYLATGFDPSVVTGRYSQDSAHLGVWARSMTVAVTHTAGQTRLIQTGAQYQSRINSLIGPVSLNLARGYGVISRSDSANMDRYLNASHLDTVASASNPLPSGTFEILRFNAAYSTGRVSAVHLGAGLTSTEVAALYDALTIYMAAIGA